MNRFKLWIVRKEATNFVDNAIKESHMSLAMKSYLVGLANAAISGIAAGSASLVAGVGFRKAAFILGASAGVSLIKWTVQHPIPDPAEVIPINKP